MGDRKITSPPRCGHTLFIQKGLLSGRYRVTCDGCAIAISYGEEDPYNYLPEKLVAFVKKNKDKLELGEVIIYDKNKEVE